MALIMLNKRIPVLSLCMLMVLPNIAYAADSNTTVNLNQEASVLDVTVPVSLPVSVNVDGSVTTANNVSIVNNNFGPISIESVQVTPKNGWSISAFDKDCSNSTVGVKEFGFKIDSVEADSGGSVNLTNNTLNGGGTKPLMYGASVSPQKDSISNSNIADVVLFGRGWF